MSRSRQARRAVLLPALVAAVLVPSTSWSHETRKTSSLSGHITAVPGGIQVTVTNTGTDAFNYFWIRLVPSVHHTGAMIDRGGGCGPGPDASTVKCGVSLAGFKPGETYTVTIMTDAPYPANGGAQLLTGPGTDGPLIPAGTADGPPAPPTPPPPPAAPAPCKCLSLTVKIPAASLKLEVGGPELSTPSKPGLGHGPPLTLDFRLVASLGCSAGSGAGCKGDVWPAHPDYYHVANKTHNYTVECAAPCGSTSDGQKSFGWPTGRDRAGLAKLGRKTIVVRRTCNGKALPPVTLWVAFDRVGRISIAKSRLG